MGKLYFNNILDQIQPSPSVAFADRIRELKAAGNKIVSLHTGDPDFDTPQIIKEKIKEALSNNFSHYSDSQGLPELRNAVAELVKNVKGASYHPDKEIIISNGGIHGFYCAVAAILNPGDEIIIITPAWPIHMNVPEMLGVTVKTVTASIENNFLPDLDHIENARTPKTKAVVINFPNNPTGAVPSQLFVDKLVEWAHLNSIWIISDEVYESITAEGVQIPYPALHPLGKNITISINSFSKTYAVTGFRIGYTLAPEEVIKRIKKASQYTITNVATFIQKGFADALKEEILETDKNIMLDVYRKRNNMVYDILSAAETGLKFIKPQGGFYYFIDASNLGFDSVTLSNKLLDESLTGMVPGSVYGKGGEGFLRMTFAASESEIEEGLKRLITFSKKLQRV